MYSVEVHTAHYFFADTFYTAVWCIYHWIIYFSHVQSTLQSKVQSGAVHTAPCVSDWCSPHCTQCFRTVQSTLQSTLQSKLQSGTAHISHCSPQSTLHIEHCTLKNCSLVQSTLQVKCSLMQSTLHRSCLGRADAGPNDPTMGLVCQITLHNCPVLLVHCIKNIPTCPFFCLSFVCLLFLMVVSQFFIEICLLIILFFLFIKVRTRPSKSFFFAQANFLTENFAERNWLKML